MNFSEFLATEHTESKRYGSFTDKLTDICARRISTVMKTIGMAEGYDLYYVVVNPRAYKTILVTAGIHGNEQAGPLAVLEYLKETRFPINVRLIMIPLLNPVGYVRQLRHNGEDRDLNRQFMRKEEDMQDEARIISQILENQHVDLFLSLHEDRGATGFYMYYSNEKRRTKYKPLLEVVEKHIKINEQKTIHGDKAEKGMILVDSRNRPSPAHCKSLEEWVRRKMRAHYICTETPGHLPLPQRVACNKAIIGWFAKNFDDVI